MANPLGELCLANFLVSFLLLHGEKFGESARPTRRTDALSTWRAARPLFG